MQCFVSASIQGFRGSLGAWVQIQGSWAVGLLEEVHGFGGGRLRLSV